MVCRLNEIEDLFWRYSMAVQCHDAEVLLDLYHYPCVFRCNDRSRQFVSREQFFSGIENLRVTCFDMGIRNIEKTMGSVFVTSEMEALATTVDKAFNERGDVVAEWQNCYLVERTANTPWKISRADMRDQHSFLTSEGRNYGFQPRVVAS